MIMPYLIIVNVSSKYVTDMNIITSDRDECATYNTFGNLCRNGGSCVNEVGTYRCLCTSGWTGNFCTNGKYSYATFAYYRRT